MALPRRRAIARLAGPALALAAGATGMAAASVTADDRPPALRSRDASGRERWLALHDGYVAVARTARPSALLLGDSLTFGWLATGRGVYETEYLPRGIHAFGIGGDRTADLSWRIRHGELSGPPPRVVSILIGTNDLPSGARRVTAGIGDCVAAVRSAVPTAAILLLCLLPRGRGGAGSPVRREIAAVNAAIERLDDGRTVRVLDIGRAFERRDGTVDPALFEPDLVHLSLEGYVVWQRAMAPTLDGLLREDR